MKRNPGILAATVVLGITGCAAEKPSRPPVCESFAAVQNTVEHIRQTNVSANGLGALQPYLTQLRDQLHQVYADAKVQFAPQAEALRAATDELTVSLQTAKAAPDVTTLAGVRSSVTDVRVAARNLHDSIASTC
jgi:lipoprotein-anchoring transpeptidase ErfK/SrfK